MQSQSQRLATDPGKLDLLMAIGIREPEAARVLASSSKRIKTTLFFECLDSLQNLTKLDGLQADRYQAL